MSGTSLAPSAVKNGCGRVCLVSKGVRHSPLKEIALVSTPRVAGERLRRQEAGDLVARPVLHPGVDVAARGLGVVRIGV